MGNRHGKQAGEETKDWRETGPGKHGDRRNRGTSLTTGGSDSGRTPGSIRQRVTGGNVALDRDPHEDPSWVGNNDVGASHSDPLRHPDLEIIARHLRDQYEEVLEAELHAARAASRRLRSLRDRLIEAEDRQEIALAYGTDGQFYRGRVSAVGTDHVVLADGDKFRFLLTHQLVGIEFE